MRIEQKTFSKSLSLNHVFKIKGLKAFGWKKMKEWTEEGEYVEYIDHNDKGTSYVDVKDSKYGSKIGVAAVETNNHWTETRVHKTSTTYQKYCRITPYTDNKKIKTCEWFYNVFAKLRDFVWVLLTIALGLTAILYIGPFFIGMADEAFENPSMLHLFVADVLKTVAIIYGILILITVILAKIGKTMLKKCTYLKKQKEYLLSRIARLDMDYKNNKIGYDAYVATKNDLKKDLAYF